MAVSLPATAASAASVDEVSVGDAPEPTPEVSVGDAPEPTPEETPDVTAETVVPGDAETPSPDLSAEVEELTPGEEMPSPEETPAPIEVDCAVQTAVDEATAAVAARECGHDVEVVEARTEWESVYAQPDGSMRLDISTSAVRTDVDGEWQDMGLLQGWLTLHLWDEVPLEGCRCAQEVPA